MAQCAHDIIPGHADTHVAYAGIHIGIMFIELLVITPSSSYHSSLFFSFSFYFSILLIHRHANLFMPYTSLQTKKFCVFLYSLLLASWS
jgi:hypothetical protein